MAARRFTGIAKGALARPGPRGCRRAVPPAGSGGATELQPLVFLRLAVDEEERQLESFSEADELKLGCGRKRLRDIPAVESPSEAHVSRAPRSHERMFP